MKNVRELAKCKACTKPSIYTERSLTNREMRALRKIILSYDYVCGCLITCNVSMLSGTVFTRLEMHCNTPIEWVCYIATKVSIQKDLCVYCAQPGAAIDQDLKKIYKLVLPPCEKCKANGKSALKRGGLQTALANRARGKQKKRKKQL